MIPSTFPTQAEQDRLNDIKKYTALYDNQAFAVLGLHDLIKKQFKNLSQLVYIAHSIPSKVSDFYGDYVQGDDEDLAIESTGSDEEKSAIADAVDINDLKEAVHDYAVDQSSIGFVVLLARTGEDGRIIIDNIPQDQYFPQKDGSVIFASYIVMSNASDPKRDLWLYTQHYRMESGKAVIERELHTVTADGRPAEKINLAMYDASLQEVEPLEIGELPVVQIDNGKRKNGFGKSDYADILPQLAEVNERTTHVAIQLLKNLDAKMVGPKGMLDENGKPVQWEVMEKSSKEDPSPEYVVNDNPLIEDTYKHVEKQLNVIAWITAVPMHEMVSSTSEPERVESLRIRLYSAVRRTKRKRSKLRKGLDKILRLGLMLAGVQKPAPIRIDFGDPLPKDTLSEAQVEDIKVKDGLSSKFSAIKRLENWDDDQVQDELDRIEEENRIAGITPAQPPQL